MRTFAGALRIPAAARSKPLPDKKSLHVPEMIRSFKEAVELWLADPTHKAKQYSLLAPEACAGPRPLGPCGWMLSDKMFRVHQPAVGTVTLPVIYRILQDKHITEKQSGRDSILFLTTGLPAPVAPELQDLLLKQLKAKPIKRLMRFLTSMIQNPVSGPKRAPAQPKP